LWGFEQDTEGESNDPLQIVADHSSEDEGQNKITNIIFDTEGTLLASGTASGELRVWRYDANAQEIEPIGEVDHTHTDDVISLAFSADGTQLVSGSNDGTAIVWNIDTDGLSYHCSTEKHIEAVSAVALNVSGGVFATGSNLYVRFWDIETCEPLSPRLSGHEEDIRTLAFNANGTLLASGGYDRAVILWDVEKKQRVGQPLIGDANSVVTIVFEDGDTLISNQRCCQVSRWETGIDHLRERACEMANRNLTWEEWQQYMGDRPYELTCPDLPPHPSVEGMWEE
jgi:WD40 repeat protein